MQARLTATVAAAWRERLRDGAAPADAAAAQAARPALHAALYGRVVATLRGWTGQPDLKVTLTMIGEAAPPALARDGDGVAAELPFGWISDVWARGLGTCWDRFCLAAAPAGDGWEVSAVGPELGAPEPITLSGPAAGRAAAGLACRYDRQPRPVSAGAGRSGPPRPAGVLAGAPRGRPAWCPPPPPPECPVTSDGGDSGTARREPAAGTAGPAQDGPASGSRCTHCGGAASAAHRNG